MNTNKITGILFLLIFVCTSTALLNENFIQPLNIQNLLRSSSMFAIIGIGAVFVIATSGIDLSIGSVVCLVGITMMMLIKSWTGHPPDSNLQFFLWVLAADLIIGVIAIELTAFLSSRRPILSVGKRWKIAALISGSLLGILGFAVKAIDIPDWVTLAVCILLAILVSLHIGIIHGLLITKLNLQPFVVTLCGLLIYRGLARWLVADQSQGLGNTYDESLRLLALGKPFNACTPIWIGGVILSLLSLLKLLLGKTDPDAKLRYAVFLAGGMILLVVGLSPQIPAWTGSDFMNIPAEKLPAVLMKWSVWLLIPIVIAMGVLVFKRLSESNAGSTDTKGKQPDFKLAAFLFPTIGLVISAVLIYLAKQSVGSEAVSLPSTFKDITADDIAAIKKAAAVFGSMTLLIVFASLFSKAVSKNLGASGNTILTAGGFVTGLWLLGNTSLTETDVQATFVSMAIVAMIAAVILNMTVYGRYIFAIGRNETAAKYSGIDSDAIKIFAYTFCAACAGIAGVLFALDNNSIEPAGHGNFFELYAIAAAVLGGCSLRGGEGNIIGVIIGASILRVLYNAPNMIGVAPQLEFFMIGIIILIGAIVDEMVKRLAARQKTLALAKSQEA